MRKLLCFITRDYFRVEIYSDFEAKYGHCYPNGDEYRLYGVTIVAQIQVEPILDRENLEWIGGSPVQLISEANRIASICITEVAKVYGISQDTVSVGLSVETRKHNNGEIFLEITIRSNKDMLMKIADERNVDNTWITSAWIPSELYGDISHLNVNLFDNLVRSTIFTKKRQSDFSVTCDVSKK